jgi:hypothetical protein
MNNNHPKWLQKLTEPQCFTSRTLHVDIGLHCESDKRFPESSIEQLLSPLLAQRNESTTLAWVQLSSPSLRGERLWASLREEMNEHFDRLWGSEIPAKSGVLGEIVKDYDKVRKSPVFFAVLVAPQGQDRDDVQRLHSIKDVKSIPWLWETLQNRQHTQLLNALLNMAFRRHLVEQNLTLSESDTAMVFHSTLLSVEAIKEDVLLGHELKLQVNYHGILVLSVVRSVIRALDWVGPEIGDQVSLNTVRRGRYKKLDARRWRKSPFLRFPTQSKLKKGGEEKERQIGQLRQTDWVKHNQYYDTLLKFLTVQGVPHRPVLFQPTHVATPPLSQINKKKKAAHILTQDYQTFLDGSHEIHVVFSGVEQPDRRQTLAERLVDQLRGHGLNNAHYRIGGTPTDDFPGITLCINEMYEQDGVNSSFWFVDKGQREVRTSLNALLDSPKAKRSNLDPYSQAKLALYHDTQGGRIIQGINCDSLLHEPKVLEPIIEKLMFELYLKEKLAKLPKTIHFPLKGQTSVSFQCFYLSSPKELPPRLVVLNGSLTESGLMLSGLDRVVCANAEDKPEKAIQRWAHLNRIDNEAKQRLLSSELSWRDSSFVIVCPHTRQLLKITDHPLYCPSLLGSYQEPILEDATGLNRVQHGSTKRGNQPHQSPVPQLAGPVSQGIYLEECKGFARIFPSLYRLQSKLDKSARLRDVSTYRWEGAHLIPDANIFNNQALELYLSMLVGDLIKDSSVSRSTLLEKMSKLACVN